MVEKVKPKEEMKGKYNEESKEGSSLQTGEVVLKKGKYIRNTASPFLSQQKDWKDEEHFKISDDILKGIVEVIKFEKPSKIQAVAIPMITKEPYHNVIAQSKNGTGKTGAFVIGSILRIDRSIKKT